MNEPLQLNNPWSLTKKIAFRASFLFFGLLIFPFPLSYFPMIGEYCQVFLEKIWSPLIQFTAHAIFSMKEPVSEEITGSGDTSYLYIQFFIIVFSSLIGCVIWSVLDRKRSSYNQLFSWVYISVRYYLAFNMFLYGFAKVFQSQFPFPSLDRLDQPLGDFSPMGLAWSYMGYSSAFNYFTGGLEVLAGLFLTFRRTSALGAILAIAVMVHVAAMNFCYDIPVKLWSSELIMMGIFVLSPDLKRIFNFFFLRKPEALSESYSPQFASKKMRTIAIIAKVILFTGVFGINFYDSYSYAEEFHKRGSRSPLYGIYTVDKFIRNNDTIPPLESDSTRWKKIIIEWPEYAQVKLMPGNKDGFSVKLDTLKKTGEVFSLNDTTKIFSFTYKIPVKEQLEFSGIYGKDTLKINFTRADEKKFMLVSRGFNWVNEYPYNR